MKLSTAFDGLAKENYFLKITVKLLLVVTAGAVTLSYALYDKTPLIVERSSRGLEIVTATQFSRSQPELKAAIAIMLRARFDTLAISPELFLNPKQMVLRDTEQKDMKARGMAQSVVVRAVDLNKGQALVDLDRVISLGEIRSALKARVMVSFEEVTPNELNPYGLLLSLANPVEQKEQK